MLKKIIFLTGSSAKLAHLRHLAKDLPLTIEGFHEASYHANYEEPRIYNREKLLSESLKSAIEQVKRSGISSNNILFLIEDTSVIIDALSSPENEVPGLDIKYWMNGVSFNKLNEMLKESGNRSVTVRSDMILFNADGAVYEHFIGQSKGEVVSQEFDFETQLLYPWLDNKTFNKWFIPNGEVKPISMLSISNAEKGDFRKNAFFELSNYLANNKLLSPFKVGKQLNLLLPANLLILVGYSCAGKTTVAQYGDEHHNFIHIEASDFMKLNFHERHGAKSDYNIEKFASVALKEQPEIVASKIIDEMSDYPEQMNVVITGFRSPKEVEYLISGLSNVYSINIIKIQADFELRLGRALKRKRTGDEATSKIELENKDRAQHEMGLENFDCQRLDNNSTVKDLFKGLDTFLERKGVTHFTGRDIFKMGSLKIEVMSFLAEKYDKQGRGAYFSTTEISKNISNHKDNISRFFNQRYSAYFDIKIIDDVKKYRLSNTGYSKIQYVILN